MIRFSIDITEAELSPDDVERIHKFGECWLANYDRGLRADFQRALWLWAADSPVVFLEGTSCFASIRFK